MSLFNELKRRNVFRVAVGYIIVGWLIMQVGEVMAPALNLPGWVNSVLAFFIILGFPLAMFFAWAFELTPEGLKKEKDVDRSQSITQTTGRKLDFTIIFLLVLALAYFAYDEFVIEKREADSAQIDDEVTETDGRKSIAVLPLADMSPQGDSEYFSDGLTEELLNILARIQELQVAGRTSSFAFKGKNEDLREIGAKLNVETILEGSVRKDDDRNKVRITLQLINVEDGYHLWSETYDRDLDDIFAIQEDVAHEVARAMRVTLLGEDEARLDQIASTDISAYELYLQGTQGIHAGGYDDLDGAVDHLQQALALDPGYLPARVALVQAWSEMARTGAITQQEALTRGMPLLQIVLAENPGNSEAHVMMGRLRVFENDHEAAVTSFTTALEMAPRNARALQEYGRYLFNRGEIERGLELIAAALQIEPYDTRVLWDQCQTNAQIQVAQAALAACDRIREIAPDSPLGYYGNALVHIYQGDIARTLKGYADAIERDPEDFEMLAVMGVLWLAVGDPERAKLWIQRAEAIGAGQAVPNNARLALYQFQEQHEMARTHALRSWASNPENRHGTNYFFLRANAYTAMQAGDFAAALEPYRETYPWAFENPLLPPADAGLVIDDLLIIASLLRRADPVSERPRQLLEFSEQHVEETLPAWGPYFSTLRRARIQALRGNNEQAVEGLREAMDMGFRWYWRPALLHDPTIADLKGDPGFKALISAFETDMDRQRALAYELLDITGESTAREGSGP